MSGFEVVAGVKETQVARLKWILRLAGEKIKVTGFNAQVINQLARALCDVLEEEQICLMYQSRFDDECKALEAGTQ